MAVAESVETVEVPTEIFTQFCGMLADVAERDEARQAEIERLREENEELREDVDDHDERLDDHDERLDDHDERIDDHDERIDGVEEEAYSACKERAELREDVDRNRDRSLGTVALVREHITGVFTGTKTLTEALMKRQRAILDAFATEGVDYERDGSVVDALDAFAEQGSVLSRFNSNEWEQMETLRTMQMRQKEEFEKKVANVLRKMHAIGEKAGIDPEEALTAYGMDTWSRIAKYGIADVVDTVRETDTRAELLVQNLVEWGEKANDDNGTRVLIRSDTLRERLRDARGEYIQSVQARRVFEKLESVCGGDVRKVKHTKSKQGKNMLVVEVGTS